MKVWECSCGTEAHQVPMDDRQQEVMKEPACDMRCSCSPVTLSYSLALPLDEQVAICVRQGGGGG